MRKVYFESLRVVIAVALTAICLATFVSFAKSQDATAVISQEIGLAVTKANSSSLPPEVDKEEVIRRGSMVQEMGSVNNSPIDVIAAALAPPEDDSHKWYITVVTVQGSKECEKLLKDFANNDALKSWANVNEPDKSWSHLQIRKIEDGTQRDWFAGIQTRLADGFKTVGAPAIVIQPPRNGKYGKNSIVAGMLFGYDGDAEKQSARIRSAILQYMEVAIVKNVHNARILVNNSDKGTKGEDIPAAPLPVGAEQYTPPNIFNVPNVQPATPSSPFDIPPERPLTLEQIQMIAGPNAPAELLLGILSAKPTTAAQVQQYVMMYNNQQPEQPQTNPTIPAQPSEAPVTWLQIISTLLNGGGFVSVLGAIVLLIRKLSQNSQKEDLILDKLRKWETGQ